MSQSRVRKAPGAAEASKTRSSIAKAAGDTSSAEPPQKDAHKSRAKNKLPKNVQYDLENALVSLCDLWFEDIKPHLVRNNIKLHVEGEAPAGGDALCRPAASATCSHDDPASASGECELCRLLAAAATSIESAVSQAAGAAASPPHLPLDVSGVEPRDGHTMVSIYARRDVTKMMEMNTSSILPTSPIERQRALCRMQQNNSNLSGLSPRPRGLINDQLHCKQQHLRPFCRSQSRTIHTPEPSDSIIRRLDSSHLTSSIPHEEQYTPVPKLYLKIKTQHVACQTDPMTDFRPINSSKKSKTKSKGSKKNVKTENVLKKAASRNVTAKNNAGQKHRPTVQQKRRKISQNTTSKTVTMPERKESSRKSKSAQRKNKNVPQYKTIYENQPFSQNLKNPIFEGRCRSMSPNKRDSTARNRAPVINGPSPRRNRTISPPIRRFQSPDKPTGPQNLRKYPLSQQTPRHLESRVAPKPRGSSPRKLAEHPHISRPSSPIKRCASPKIKGPSMSMGNQPLSFQPVCKKSTKTTSFVHPGCGDKQERDSQIRSKRVKTCSARKEKKQFFDKDLIDIIGKNNDKRLEVLYHSPNMKESCSISMLHLCSPADSRRYINTSKLVAVKPWR